ncbi:FtsK/SpoIIIE domain-containing protein [Salinibacterium sp. ZJ454]|uniref:FtsK/SpoIIIE domain-containing protein n=1 Tax=Salinibacterium sp. ZJ454 TaxID=2708339 RepID=UPI00141E3BCD|nr:FtsK/SpoIIIE domain-containing protein [Salinibacterium sp. ZJ454]
MRLKLTLTRASGVTDDIVVSTDATATVGEVAQALLRSDPRASELAHGTAPFTLRAIEPGSTGGRTLDQATPIGEARVSSGSSISVVSSRPRDVSGAPLAVLRALDGPLAGQTFSVPAGTSILGRDKECDVVLDDPQVSKRHLRIEAGASLELIDLNSANGIIVDGGLVNRLTLQTGQSALIGSTTLRVDTIIDQAPSAEGELVGPVHFNRSPRVEVRYPGEEYEGPTIPQEIEPVIFPWLAMLAPLILGAVLYAVTRNPLSVVFVALSPILMIGTWTTQFLANRAKLKRAIKKFEGQLERLDSKLATEAVTERAVRLAEAPSTEEAMADAVGRGTLLWTRRPEHWSFLNLRLGVGTAPSRNSIKVVNNSNGLPEFSERSEALTDKFRFIEGVPLVDNLADAGAIGIAGLEGQSAPVTHALLAQLASLHSPAELAFSAIVSPYWSAEFEWLKWLPHTGSPQSPLPGVQLADSTATGLAVLAALEELIEMRLASRRSSDVPNLREAVSYDASAMNRGATVGDESLDPENLPITPCLVVLISDDAPVDRARLVQLAERAASAGVLPIWIARTVAALPAACRTNIDVTAPAETATVNYVRLGLSIPQVQVSRVPAQTAMAFALRLAPVVDAGALIADESDIPQSVSFLQLLGTDLATSGDAVVDRWRQNDSIHDRTPGAPLRKRRGGKLRALVGQSNVDALHLDLRTQGPHALVGGTTGSGKSEFLQAWVLGMAAEYSPDRVTFLFVDYKGGSAFADCVSLPHTVGLVTDLSPHLVRRALTSLRAELHHREHLFNRKKAKDLIELEKRGDPEAPPALVLVIDEFAALVNEVPEFVDGVVDIAQRGRSLGIHLIMATQRPAGVIKDNLRANTNLRVALRMADEADSTDVVGAAIAAGFDPGAPGRAVAKTGPGRLTHFQTGYAGGWTTDTPARAAVQIMELAYGHDKKWEDVTSEVEDLQADLGPNDTARLVASMTAAARLAALPAPRKPWLDELATAYDLGKLRQRTDTELLLGVSDDPSHQDQRPVYFRPDADGNLAVYGTGGSGKSTVLRTLAVAAGITPKGGPMQVYALDFAAGGLRMLESLPHVGSVVSGGDAERVARLLSKLKSIIEERVGRYAAVRAGTVTDYRALAAAPAEPRILLLVDGMATFRQEYEFTGAGGIFTQFQQIVTDGRQVGVHVAISADRPGSLSPAIAASIQRKVVLRLADENDYSLLDAPSDVLSAVSPAGRAVIDQLETQIAVLGGSTNVSEQSAAIEALAVAMRRSGVPEAPAVERLADEIALADLFATVPGAAVIGVADDTLTPVTIEPSGVFMVAGPPSSGRTTSLGTFALASRAARPATSLAYFGNARSQIGSLDLWTHKATVIDAATELARELLTAASTPATPTTHLTIVIESISDFLGSPADADLIALIKAAKRNDHYVIAESESSTWQQSWPLLMEFKAGRRGFALQPDTSEGDILFRTSFPRSKRADFPEGRGWLVQAGSTRKVQLGRPF